MQLLPLTTFYFGSSVQPFNSRHYAERTIIIALRSMFIAALHDDILQSMYLASYPRNNGHIQLISRIVKSFTRVNRLESYRSSFMIEICDLWKTNDYQPWKTSHVSNKNKIKESLITIKSPSLIISVPSIVRVIALIGTIGLIAESATESQVNCFIDRIVLRVIADDYFSLFLRIIVGTTNYELIRSTRKRYLRRRKCITDNIELK